MARATVVLIAAGLFVVAFVAMALTTGAEGGAIYTPFTLNWFVYLGIQALFVGILLPFVPVFLVSWLVLKRNNARELSFKIAAAVTLAWIVLGAYGQLSHYGA